MEQQKTFRLGISMAGAISAGAYTAGVMDYLLEALESWQKAKELDLPGVPKHEVVVEVINGASAGGMTAVITAAALQKDFPHVNQQNYFSAESRENPLFDSWVNLTEVPGHDMMSQMLGPEDITADQKVNPYREVRSIFNSLFIEKIARRTLDATVREPGTRRPYFADDFELFTTLTNLRGFDYELEFITAAGKREDRMTMHKDLVHFQFNPSGTYRNDGKIPFHFNTIDGLNKNLLIDAAIATGAFPVGLAPRVVIRDPRYINDNHLLKITHGKTCLVDPLTDYNAVCVDGGVINNEPYDLTSTILTNRKKETMKRSENTGSFASYQLPKSAADFDTTILMIDPFPNYEDKPPANYFDLLALKFTVPELLGSMRQQLMVKTDLLERAYDDNDYTRFMIAPIRTKGGVTQKYPIACGSLGGFGGFFSKKFRIHDYMLGRRNCQRFIQQYFCVPAEAQNPLINFGYEHLDGAALQSLQPETRKSLPIIPDIRLSDDHSHIIKPPAEDEFPYPTICLTYLTGLEEKMQKRLAVVLDHLPNGYNPVHNASTTNPVVKRIRKRSWFERQVIDPVIRLVTRLYLAIGKYAGKKIAAGKFVDMVVADMDERGLLKQDK